MDTRSASHKSDTVDDLSALAWVHDELRRSLEAAHKSLRRYLKEAEAVDTSDVDSVDPAVLRAARAQIHQGVGALELVGLPAAAQVLRASEAAVQRFVAKPQKLTPQVVDDIEHASFALLDFLSRLLAGKSVSTLAMFPQYRAVQEAAGAERIHPADLWALDWRWRELPTDTQAQPRAIDEDTRGDIESQLLATMRSPQPVNAASRLSDICAGIGAGADQLQVATLWKIASAVFEAQAHRLLGFDVFSKRVASRLLAQYRVLQRGENEVSERLAQDLLFFCAQSESPGDGRHAPRLAGVRQAYGLAHHVPVNYEASELGRFDPAVVVQARKRVGAAKESWSAVAGGELHRMSGLGEQFALVSDSLKRLFPLGELFAAELQMAVAQSQAAGAAPPPPLAMEVATSLLYVEAALEDIEFDHPEQAERVRRLADRLGAVREGRPPEPLEGWMEELYRRVSDRQTMGSVVQELRASLSEAEKLIDQYFRNPAEREVLIPVPNQLSAMRGVMSVLGMDHASATLLRMRDDVESLVQAVAGAEGDAQNAAVDRLAGNLGALGFLIDMLSVQPHLAKSLFVFDPTSGTLDPVMGRGPGQRHLVASLTPAAAEQRLIEQAQMLAYSAMRDDVPVEEVARDLERLSHEAQLADQSQLAATVELAREALDQAADQDAQVSVRGELSDALVDFVSTASDSKDLAPEIAELRARPIAPPSTPFASAAVTTSTAPGAHTAELADDDDMREIFLEEAQEVLLAAGAATAGLENATTDLSLLTTVRRAFHTLKGSSRMVGLREFGEAAWACEQLYNTQLADHRAAHPALLDFTRWALGELAIWVDDIAARRDAQRSASPIQAGAQRLSAGETDFLLESAQQQVLPSAPPVVVDLGPPPLAAELEPLSNPRSDPPAAPIVAIERLDGLSFELDLPSDMGLPPVTAPVALSGGAEPSAPDTADTFSTLPLPLSELPQPPSEADLSIELIELDFSEPSDVPAAHADARAAATSEVAASTTTEEQAATDPLPVLPSIEPALAAVAAEAPTSDEEQVKLVGPLRIGIPLFNIFLNEADELSRRLTTELAEWAMELHRPVGETAIALAHSLAGSSATVGFNDLSHLARLLEHAEMRSQAIGHGTSEEARLFVDAAEEVRRLLHQFAAGFLVQPPQALLDRLAQHEITSARRLEAATAAAELPASSALGALDDAPELADDVPHAADERDLVAQPQAVVESYVAMDSPVPPGDTGATIDFAGREPQFDPVGVADLKPLAALPAESSRTPVRRETSIDGAEDIDAIDAVDAELFPIFEEEGSELLPQLSTRLRDWARRPSETAHAAACMRTLHTLKGGARLAGAMRLGEMAHRLETRIEHLLAHVPVQATDVEQLQSLGDGLAQVFEALRLRDAQAYEAAEAAVVVAAASAAPADATVDRATGSDRDLGEPMAPHHLDLADQPMPDLAEMPEAWPAQPDLVQVGVTADAPEGADPLPGRPLELPAIDWSRFVSSSPTTRVVVERNQGAAQAAVRVKAPLLDRLVNQAGEVSITRSRIESEVGQIKGSLGDLTENLERLRGQLRDIELQAETQMSSRLEAAKALSQSFDPLEFDRFTRFQELTRMMAESVNDVATVQRTLQRALDSTEDELASQARLTRDLQDDLLRTRMVEFESQSDRLYRVVRQAAKETGKQVRLDIVGGSIEVDRGVLDRMTGSFEHLLRNCVTHGIEAPTARVAAGKDDTGTIIVSLTQEGNEVGVEFRDDGRGLDLERIRAKGEAMGLLAPDERPGDAELANLIFSPGFSTADTVTELAGRGVGMDVVRSEVNAMGGRIETATAAGQGTSFKLVLPLTTAVTQVVMLRCGETSVAVPSTLIEIVRRATPAEVDHAYATRAYLLGDRLLPFYWLGALLQSSPRSAENVGRTRTVVVVRSAQQRVALHVDEVLGNQEVVVKNLGVQLSRLPGLAGMTLLASGAVSLIYNPVALATLYGEAAQAATLAALRSPNLPALPIQREPEVAAAPLVLVVDDSLTVRRVTQRLLVREGYRVVLAKDGMDALERLAEEVPQVILSDIEMPRMDGFDLVRNIRADARLRALPVIMITSRIAQKHRDYAAQLGVDHYLGKPYSEEDLLALIGRYTTVPVTI